MSTKNIMRAKMRIADIESSNEQQHIKLEAVGRSDAYPEDGSDENNTFSKFTPTANLNMTVTNPALAGKFNKGQEFYVDFREVKN